MFKKETRNGLALGAIVSLLASLFVSAPAANANTNGVVLESAKGTSLTMVVTEEFGLNWALGASVLESKASQVTFLVEKPAGYHLSVSFHATHRNNIAGADTVSAPITSVSTMSYYAPYGNDASTSGYIMVQPSSMSGGVSLSSVSAAVNVTITAFLDLNGDGDLDSGEPTTVKVVAFKPWASAFSATLAADLPAGASGDTLTVSATLTGPVNMKQLNDSFYFSYNSPNDNADKTTFSAAISSNVMAAGDASASTTVAASTAKVKYGAYLAYGAGAAANIFKTLALATKAAVLNDGVVVKPVTSSALTGTAANAATVKTNAEFQVSAYAYTGATVVKSVAVKTKVTTDQALSDDAYLVINGTTYTDNDDLPSTSGVAVPASGKVTIKTVGYDGGETVTITAVDGNGNSFAYTANVTRPTYTLEDGVANVSVKPGASFTWATNVEDQWGYAPARSNLRIVAHWEEGTISESATTSAVTSVVAGKKAYTITVPGSKPAGVTGSATVAVTLQTQNLDSGAWSQLETERISVNISTLADAFTSSLTATQSAEISYVKTTGYSWSGNFVGTVVNPGATVVVSAPGVVFKDSLGITASATLTLRSDGNGTFTFSAAAEKAGSHTISVTTGGTTTTSQLIVEDAAYNSGASIQWSADRIDPGATSTITGTLVDANGNPVATGDTASLTVTYVGKGLLIGTIPSSTDDDGEFSLNILAGSNDTGVGAITVVYKEEGAGSTAKQTLKVVKAISIAAAPAPVVDDTKVNAGSFKGYVAIYAKGYAGQRLSAKVGNDWVVVESLASDFERVVEYTGAGYTIAVRIYIDRVLVDTITVTTK
jgi:hypothetical protein